MIGLGKIFQQVERYRRKTNISPDVLQMFAHGVSTNKGVPRPEAEKQHKMVEMERKDFTSSKDRYMS